MNIGRRVDLFEAVVVEVADRQVLVVHIRAVARLALVAGRPARSQATIGLVHAHLFGLPLAIASVARPPNDDLLLAIIVQVIDRQAAHLGASAKRVARPDLAAVTVVERQLVILPPDNQLQPAVAGQVGHCHPRPNPPIVRGPPAQAARGAIERDKIVRALDYLRLPVAIQVGHCRRAVPAGLAVAGRTASIGPL